MQGATPLQCNLSFRKQWKSRFSRIIDIPGNESFIFDTSFFPQQYQQHADELILKCGDETKTIPVFGYPLYKGILLPPVISFDNCQIGSVYTRKFIFDPLDGLSFDFIVDTPDLHRSVTISHHQGTISEVDPFEFTLTFNCLSSFFSSPTNTNLGKLTLRGNGIRTRTVAVECVFKDADLDEKTIKEKFGKMTIFAIPTLMRQAKRNDDISRDGQTRSSSRVGNSGKLTEIVKINNNKKREPKRKIGRSFTHNDVKFTARDDTDFFNKQTNLSKLVNTKINNHCEGLTKTNSTRKTEDSSKHHSYFTSSCVDADHKYSIIITLNDTNTYHILIRSFLPPHPQLNHYDTSSYTTTTNSSSDRSFASHPPNKTIPQITQPGIPRQEKDLRHRKNRQWDDHPPAQFDFCVHAAWETQTTRFDDWGRVEHIMQKYGRITNMKDELGDEEKGRVEEERRKKELERWEEEEKQTLQRLLMAGAPLPPKRDKKHKIGPQSDPRWNGLIDIEFERIEDAWRAYGAERWRAD
ncbi:hypothetical protein BLNAU_6790 [Blattamonas nauphoetae]|uniref:Uncharacterized protein n=1 Tax=Blattamonas nauphoetae TaxID=2049346 RepID=A0ABQ9Y3I2_9EUKA|nr:hypothetical protein BLNAU_6790 [Blattamonas nauphoetae]